MAAMVIALPLSRVLAQSTPNGGYQSPVGVTGLFSGNVTTGCSYDPLSHNARRQVDDIVVPGSIGKYPLKMTRYYNSRKEGVSSLGPGWSYEYGWGSSGSKIAYPDGNVNDHSCFDVVGASDRWETAPDGTQWWRLADGGAVIFDSNTGAVNAIVDPYGQKTTIQRGTNWTKVTEPGGRYLYFTLNQGMLTRVDAHGHGDATITDWVIYHYAPKGVDDADPSKTMNCLTQVDYSDGTHAYYDYVQDNVANDTTAGTIKVLPLLSTCDDVRYNGPMRQIAYDYQNHAQHGVITAERSGLNGLVVSSIGNLTITSLSMPTNFTETRGDDPSRTFTYTDLRFYYRTGDNCPSTANGVGQQFLLSYTDFQGHTTQLGYDANWFVNSVQDAGATRQTTSGAPALAKCNRSPIHRMQTTSGRQ
jgi:hypothetical protein